MLRHLVKFSPFLDYHDLKLSKRVGAPATWKSPLRTNIITQIPNLQDHSSFPREEEEEEAWDATATATTPNNTHSPAAAAARSRRFAAL